MPMARIAMPSWNGRISPVFDAARELLVVDVEGGRELRRSVQPLREIIIPRRVGRLAELGVNVLICGGISSPLLRMVEGAGIRVLPWMSGDVNEVLHAHLAGSLLDGRFAMPGRAGPKGPRYRGGRRNWPS